VRAKPFSGVHGNAAAGARGIWSLRRIPLDALPDISDVQSSCIHRGWPAASLIEDQVTYPIVTKLLAAPHVKAVRAAKRCSATPTSSLSSKTERIFTGAFARPRIHAANHGAPACRSPSRDWPDATGAGWVYEYVVVDRSHQRSLAELRKHSRLVLALSARNRSWCPRKSRLSRFVKQYQVNLDPNKLRAYNIPLSKVMRRCGPAPTRSADGCSKWRSAIYDRGLGYLRSLSDLEAVPVVTKNGTAVLVRDLAQ